MPFRIAKSEDSDLALRFFGKQLVLEILEHLPYMVEPRLESHFMVYHIQIYIYIYIIYI